MAYWSKKRFFRHMSDKQHAVELLDRLDAGQLAAVVHLLEAMVEREEDEQIGAEEESAVARSKQWFQHNDGIPFEQVVADLGFTTDAYR
jgi:hypothetical protein